MNIALDVMGGDNAPSAPIMGAMEALGHLNSDDRILLVGQGDVIRNYLREHNIPESTFDIVETSEVISQDENATTAFSKRKDSSINVGYYLMRKGLADAFASAGNTGAILIGALYILNNIPGNIRPCIPALIPRASEGYSLILDVGSNPDARPDVLYQYGMIGSVYAEKVLGIKEPKVALLNIGEEEKKGNLLAQATYKMMKGSSDFNFIGNIEGRDLFGDKADIIVCDGFTGNIVLKQIEGFYDLLISKNVNDPFFNRYNYEIFGGTPILGVNGIAMIAHGISGPLAINSMIKETVAIYRSGLINELQTLFKRYSD